MKPTFCGMGSLGSEKTLEPSSGLGTGGMMGDRTEEELGKDTGTESEVRIDRGGSSTCTIGFLGRLIEVPPGLLSRVERDGNIAEKYGEGLGKDNGIQC